MVGRPRHQVRLSVIKQLSDIELDVATEFFILHFTDLNKVGPGDN